MRIVVLAVLLVVFCAGSSLSFAASQTRTHKKTAAASQSKTKTRAASRPASDDVPASRTSARKSKAKAKAKKDAAPAHASRASRKRSAQADDADTTPARSTRKSRTKSARETAAPSSRRRQGALRRDVDLPRAHSGRRGLVAQPAPAAPAARSSRSPNADSVDTAPSTTQRVAAASKPILNPPSPASTASVAAAPTGAIPLHAPIVAMAPLRGSMESLVRQNEKTDADNLERIEDDADLEHRIAQGMLVPVPASDGLIVNPGLPQNRRYCRPWTASFLADLARAHQATFHRAFIVSSAVRTVQYQKQLMRTNGNAAAAEGDVASPHLTGATIDIAKSGMTRQQLYWMRNRLDALQDEGKIDVEEEFRQACFHITVYKSYIGAGPLHKHHRDVPATNKTAAPDGPPVEGD